MNVAELVDIYGRLDITDWRFWLAFLAAMAGLLLLGWGMSRLRMRTYPEDDDSPKPDAWATFQEKLAAIRAQMDTLDARELTYLVNSALRAFIEDRLQLPASEQTTEEFIQSLQSNDSIHSTVAEALMAYLGQCDLIKYAGQNLAETDKSIMVERAETLAQQLQSEEN